MRAAALAGGWLLLVCAVVIASVALPLLARIGICLAIATPALAAIRTSLLLRGARAVRGLQWSGGWTAGGRAGLWPAGRDWGWRSR